MGWGGQPPPHQLWIWGVLKAPRWGPKAPTEIDILSSPVVSFENLVTNVFVCQFFPEISGVFKHPASYGFAAPNSAIVPVSSSVHVMYSHACREANPIHYFHPRRIRGGKLHPRGHGDPPGQTVDNRD